MLLRSIVTSDTPFAISVPALRLDEWVANAHLQRLDFVKIDVEGFEADVLLPSLHILNRFKPTICFEYIEQLVKERSAFSPDSLFTELKHIGYAIERLDKSGNLHGNYNIQEDWTNDYVAKPTVH
jgi:hypothetical protein